MVLCADREKAKREFNDILAHLKGNQKNVIYFYVVCHSIIEYKLRGAMI